MRQAVAGRDAGHPGVASRARAASRDRRRRSPSRARSCDACRRRSVAEPSCPRRPRLWTGGVVCARAVSVTRDVAERSLLFYTPSSRVSRSVARTTGRGRGRRLSKHADGASGRVPVPAPNYRSVTPSASLPQRRIAAVAGEENTPWVRQGARRSPKENSPRSSSRRGIPSRQPTTEDPNEQEGREGVLSSRAGSVVVERSGRVSAARGSAPTRPHRYTLGPCTKSTRPARDIPRKRDSSIPRGCLGTGIVTLCGPPSCIRDHQVRRQQ